MLPKLDILRRSLYNMFDSGDIRAFVDLENLGPLLQDQTMHVVRLFEPVA
jgi:hypothetical protein